MPKPPQDIYARHLSSPRGYPLWTPEPSNELLAYRRDGLKIGDVGVVIPEDGCFDVFFNICLSRNHPFHQATGVPDNFEPIELSDVDIRTVVNAENPGRIIATSSVKRVRTVERSGDSSSRNQSSKLEYEFNLSSSEGALLILPEGAQRHDLRNHHRFLEAATQHGADWYRFAEEGVGQIIGHDSLYLITGLYKTSSWSLAAFEKTAGTAEYPAQFKVSQVGGDDIAAAYTWDTTRALDWRVGPIDSLGIPNQAVFIRGFKIALRTWMFGTRWISVKADIPSTRPNPAKSIGAVPGDSWLGYLLGGPSTDRVTESSGRGTQDEVVADSALDAARNEIQNNGALAVGEHVVIQRVPGASQAFHPSDIINRYLLNKEPSANIAITHDDDWITMLEENLLRTKDLAQEGRLETLLSQEYDIISAQSAVYLERRRDNDPGTSDDADKVDATVDDRELHSEEPATTVTEAVPSKSLSPISFALRHRDHHLDVRSTLLRGHKGSIMFVAFLSDDQIISASDEDKTIRRWNLSDGRGDVIKELVMGAVATSPNGRWVATGGRDGRVRLFALETRTELPKSVGRHADVIKSLSFSPDSSQLASGAQDGTIFIWSSTTLEPVAGPLEGHEDPVWWVCYSPDGRKIASCDREVIRVWDSTYWVGMAIKDKAWSLAWSPDGDTFFAGCIDGSINRYNPNTGRLLATYNGHRDVVVSIALSHNAKFIATASWDKTIRLWEAATFQQIGSILPHDAKVHSISISPDDSHLVSGVRDSGIHVWSLRTIVPSLFEDFRRRSVISPVSNHKPDVEHDALVQPRGREPLSHTYPLSVAPPFSPGLPRDGTIDNLQTYMPLAQGGDSVRIYSIPNSSRSTLAAPSISDSSTSTLVSPTTSVFSLDGEIENGSFIRDIRSGPTHDLTSDIVQEGSHPVAGGSHGDIYTGFLHMNGRVMRVAIKVIRIHTARDDDQSKQRHLRREIRLRLTLDHKNVIPLLGITKAYGDFPAMVYPWVENGSLTSYLDRRTNDLTAQLRLCITNDVALGIQYLHSKYIAHGDISGSNVLIYSSGRACIADFSLSTVETDIEGSSMASTYQVRGTIRYTAPELFYVTENEDKDAHKILPTLQSDIYSFGGIMLQVLTGKVPYHYLNRDSQVLAAVIMGKHPERPTSTPVVSDEQWHFMRRCWSFVATERPSDLEMVTFVHDQLLDAIAMAESTVQRRDEVNDYKEKR